MRVRCWAYIVAGSFFLLFAACDSDEFEGAPTARAPDEPLVKKKKRKKRRASAKSEQVPSGHPPVGNRQKKKGSASGGAAGPGAGGGDLPVEWKAPSGWTEEKPSSRMRETQFRIPGAEGAGPATLAVFHLPGSQGKTQANIDRWVGQFDPPGDAAPSEVATQETRRVGGAKVHIVQMKGTYKGMGRTEPKENYRLLGAIVETNQGPVIFKMVGPAETVAAREGEFDRFVGSFQTGP